MDIIQQKLAQLDKQLAGRVNPVERIIKTCPLLFAAVGLISGILLGRFLELSVTVPLFLLALCAITTVLLFVVSKGKRHIHKIAYLTALCFLCLGGLRQSHYTLPKTNDIRELICDERQLAVIRGQIITSPYISTGKGWQFAKFRHSDPSSSFYLKIREIESTDGWVQASGTVRVQVAEPIIDLQAGDRVQVYCRLSRFNKAANPGQFDVAEYMAAKNVFVAAFVKSRDAIVLLEKNSAGVFTKIKMKLRQAAGEALAGESVLESDSKALLEALLLGYRGNIDNNTYRSFRQTGLLHFISLSGMHLGILIGIIWWLCKTAGLLKRSRSAVCIIALTVFLLIVPPRPPTLRAAVICFVFCGSFFFRRKPNSFNSLSLAAIILLLIRPTGLFEAGWQLSFASVLGILLFSKRFHLFLYEKITSLTQRKKAPITKPFSRIASRYGPYLLGLFTTGITAWMGGAGILLYHFYTINPLTSIWTVVVFPFVAVILTIGYLKIILSFLLPSLAALLGVIVTAVAKAMIWLVAAIANLDISQILIGNVPGLFIVFYYIFILFAVFTYFRRPFIKKVICTTAALAIIVFLGATKWQRTYRDNLVLTCLDVGHGQAILAQMPGKTNILFDAGSLYTQDVGNRIVIPFLNYMGISKIDKIIISHNDVDHINGICEIVQNCQVDSVYANEAFFSKKDKWGTAKFLNEFLGRKGFKIQHLAQQLELNSDASVKVIWPSRQINYDELSDNDTSVVCLVEFAGRKILLCSDIEKFAQGQIMRLQSDLKPDVVILPHHGSTKTLDADFLKNLQANILICSCGQKQYESQRSDKGWSHFALETKNGSGQKPKLFYTAKDGAITLRINKTGTVKTGTFLEQ